MDLVGLSDGVGLDFVVFDGPGVGLMDDVPSDRLVKDYGVKFDAFLNVAFIVKGMDGEDEGSVFGEGRFGPPVFA
jgi:hypothetical protein